MHVVNARNVQGMLPKLLAEFTAQGQERTSRNGPVLKMPLPTTLVYGLPRERVLFWAEREANPFFHIMESLYFLAGRNDVKFLSDLVPTMAAFSDDGKTFHGSYGHRWRRHFGYDQLPIIIEALKKNPDDRRCVLQMWAANGDLGNEGKDFPCNTQVMFAINEGELDMTVVNRSNDAVWGATGANAVHFSVLQEYMASMIGVPVGMYWQVSNNMHLYTERHSQLLGILGPKAEISESPEWNPYVAGIVEPFPMVSTSYDIWERDLGMFLSEGMVVGLTDPFFRKVAGPMWMAYKAFKKFDGDEKYEAPLEILERCAASDWRLAGQQWIERRQKKHKENPDAQDK